MRRYPIAKNGEWWKAGRRLRLACCDCGLVHTVDIKLVPHGRGKRILWAWWREERRTAQLRRHRHGKAAR